ncbi:iron-containing alcohol dehydrogenase [Amycolatopsis sp. K13G38]|uniref:Iron-containing alcohol dehydrogenase n=1 Tax=Amycolatopsis acididurans TaxID=2724524 RepID=A0ABX1JB85_9PSEU|nr:iron-containing alcohol dehydrogenase [Amycolatopsis acididurans]NKQ56954.1 iron-containing alcohol dehydrogenase [Amycolatopsis acididurans]
MPARTFTIPPADTVTYGEGAFDQIGALLDRVGGSRALAILSGSLAGSAVEQALRDRLGARLVAVHSGIPQHVPRAAVLHAAEAARESGVDSVLSVGGGTPIDCAKAVTLCLAENITEPDQFEKHRVRFTYPDSYEIPEVHGTLIPHIAVPTTLSGGEHTALFGVTDEITHRKCAYTDPGFQPKAVVLDPWVCAATPDWLWAASGMRAVDHAVEGILSTRHMALTDGLGAEALRLISRNLAHSKKNPGDAEARTNCLLGTWLSIFGLTNAGVGLSHGIGHQLAAEFDILHGLTSAIMLPLVMEFTREQTGPRLRLIAEAFGTDTREMDDAAAADAAIGAVRGLIGSLGLTNTISAAGGRREVLPAIAEHVMTDPAVAACPRPVTQADVLNLLEAAWATTGPN